MLNVNGDINGDILLPLVLALSAAGCQTAATDCGAEASEAADS